MTRIRAVQFPIIEEYQKILQTVLPLFIRKGAKKKTELPEKEVATMVRALGFNPTDEQVENWLQMQGTRNYILLQSFTLHMTTLSKGCLSIFSLSQVLSNAIPKRRFLKHC